MKHINSLYLIAALLLGFVSARSQNVWPKEISVADGSKIKVYEPQPESFSGNTMTGRAAVSIRKTETDEPVFGAIFFTATLKDNNNSSKKAGIESLSVTNAKFSGVEDQEEVDKLAALIQRDAPGWSLGMSTDELVDAVERENGTADGDEFNNAAPRIIYANKPTSLVVLDGAPRILYDKDLKADKVVNSPNIIFKEGKQWNLYAGGNWYKSNSVTGGWKQNTKLSQKAKSVNEAIKKQEIENNNGKAPATDPRLTDIIVATEPTELLQTDGEPVYKNVAGTSLLYVSNSPNEIFKDINSQKTYVLIAGRWYHSSRMNGPWEYVPSDRLPEDFAKIPEGSDKNTVLANVAGTDAAEEAKMDAQVPQTAKVDRRTATVDVEYDGDPLFNPIEGTSLQLAENANLTVMIDPSGNYFALDNGVWFISDDPYGPWSVANDRPRDIDDIPASSRAYNSRYVYIYDYTPDYVYTGYTSGYLGSYICGPTIVYGTGYHYRPWFHRMYYPRPITWGFGFMYNPWYGWSMNYGYNFGFLYVGFDYGYSYGYGYGYGGGWFGPSRYYLVYRRPYWNGGYYGRNYYGRNYPRRDYYGGGNRDYGNRAIAGNGRPSGISEPSRRNGWRSNYNIYQNQRGVTTQSITRTNRAGNISRLNNNTTRPIGIDNNRLPGNNNNNRVSEDGNNNNRLQRNENPREPVIHNPSTPANSNNTGREDVFRRDAQNGRPTGRVTNPNSPVSRDNAEVGGREENASGRNNQNANRPDNRAINPTRVQQPTERRVVRPDNVNRNAPAVSRPAPAQRPSVNRQPASPQRPSVQRQSSPSQRPTINRPSAPAQRPAAINRPSAPSIQRSAPTQRQSAPQGGSSGGNNSSQGRRPDRR